MFWKNLAGKKHTSERSLSNKTSEDLQTPNINGVGASINVNKEIGIIGTYLNLYNQKKIIKKKWKIIKKKIKKNKNIII